MGKKEARRLSFIKEHPLCCFCGGTTSAEEMDHIPSRTIFDNRQWPEGYVFPACVKCNRSSRHAENIISMISRLNSVNRNSEESKTFEKCAKAVARNYPGLLEEMRPSIRLARKAARRYEIELPQGLTVLDLPFVSLDSPRIDDSIHEFGNKLFLALYYKHTRRILPQSGGVAIKWFTNLEMDNGAIPEYIFSIISQIPIIKRSKDLGDQFFYKYGVTACTDGAGFVVVFRMSFALVGIIHTDFNKLDAKNGMKVSRPLNHNQQT